MDGNDWLGKSVVARTGPGDVVSTGTVIGYCGAPTLTIEREDGTQFTWRADMCKPVPVKRPDKETYEKWLAKYKGSNDWTDAPDWTMAMVLQAYRAGVADAERAEAAKLAGQDFEPTVFRRWE